MLLNYKYFTFSTLQQIIQASKYIQSSPTLNYHQLAKYHQFFQARPTPFDLKIYKKQISFQKLLYKTLIHQNLLSQTIFLLTRNHKTPLYSQTIQLLTKYLITQYTKLNISQKIYLSYYLSIYRQPIFYFKLKNNYIQLRQTIKQPQNIDKTQLDLLYTYSELVNQYGQIQDFSIYHKYLAPKINTIANKKYQKELNQIKTFFSSNSSFNNPQSGLKTNRSQLQLEVQCILRTINVEYKRQVLLYCYTVDFLIDQKIVIEVFGPSHYVSGSIVKGDQLVRERILKKNGYKFIVIDHTEWSSVKGIRNQIRFIQNLLKQGRGE